LAVIAAAAVVGIWMPTTNTVSQDTLNSTPEASAPGRSFRALSLQVAETSKPEFSIHGVRLGMSRETVEEYLGTGDPSGPNHVAYGRKWMETNPFDVERRNLRIGYDEQGFVNQVTGNSPKHSGVSVRPQGATFELGKFGPSKNPGIACRTGGDFDNAVMLSYPDIGVEVEYYNEDRMWFSIWSLQPKE
jgi:hypothetical protein